MACSQSSSLRRDESLAAVRDSQSERLVLVAHYEPGVHDTLLFRPRVVTTSAGEYCSAALGTHPRHGEVVLVVPCDGQVEVPAVRKVRGKKYGSEDRCLGSCVKVCPALRNEALA